MATVWNLACIAFHSEALDVHANTNGVNQTSLSGIHHGFMPPQLKTKRVPLSTLWNMSDFLYHKSVCFKLILVHKGTRAYNSQDQA